MSYDLYVGRQTSIEAGLCMEDRLARLPEPENLPQYSNDKPPDYVQAREAEGMQPREPSGR